MMTAEDQYFRLARQLEKRYPDSSFRDHCYWRIALDNTLQAKWDTVIKRPAYKHLDGQQMKQVISLLQAYEADEELLKKHNRKSLQYRKKPA
ncbi:MAG: hypothetical protein WBB45_13515 [Cyclobacteriaceae bacterium]